MASPRDVPVENRVLRVHEAGAPASEAALTLLWHHGSPQTGAPLEPLVSAAAARGIRLLTYARPSYDGSTPRRGRDVASAAEDVTRIADALELERFAVMGASGGGPHALACAALLPERIVGAVCLASLAPRSDDVEWYAGMAAPGGLRAAAEGRTARERFAEIDEFDAAIFTPADWAALRGSWASLGTDAAHAEAGGAEGLVDDDLAFAGPWGFDPARIEAPVLLIQGGQDRVVPAAHARWLLHAIPTAELWLRPHDGHVSILDACPLAMDWLLARVASA